MNITISKELHDYLQTIILETVIFGSRANNGNMVAEYTDQSDYDYLHIIKCHKSLNVSPIYTGHWLQYKEYDESGKVIADHIYSTIPQFVHGIIESESMINWLTAAQYHGDNENSIFRLMHCSSYIATENGYRFIKCNDIKYNFKVIRGFLGLARRDLKDATKLYQHDKKKTSKKIKFARESMIWAVTGLEEITNTNTNWDYGLVLLDWSNWDTDYKKFKECIDILDKICNEMRDMLTDMNNKRTIAYTASANSLKNLHREYLSNIEFLDDNHYSNMMMDYYYKAAIENEYR